MIGASKDAQSKGGPKLNMAEIMEECKAFFFAGHETTAQFANLDCFLVELTSRLASKTQKKRC